MNTLDRDIESSTASALSTPSKPTPGGLLGHSYLLGFYLRRWLRYVASDSQIPGGKSGWLQDEEFIDAIAVAQSAPGLSL